MANTIKVKRGTDANRAGVTPAEGELLYTTDTKKVYVGDGSTAGGNEVGGGGGSSQTPAELLADIKTVDGSGSGLDADLLDGQQGSYYAAASSLSSYLPLSGGTLTGNLNFGDNDVASFGAGSDLQIYHDGSNSFISDQGSGDLVVLGSNLKLRDSQGNDYVSMNDTGTGGTVFIKHSGNTKLATTSTGIDVTGTATVDGLTSSGAINGSDITANGYLQATSYLYTRDNLRVLNSAGTGWNTWGTRVGGAYNLNVGTITATGGNSTNWNTAYGWGNHASAGYLLSTSYTASDVLTKIKTVDGSGSGLDADLLDGQQGSYYAAASHNHNGTYTPYNDIRSLGVRAFTNGTDPNITTAQVISEIESDGGFDSYTSAFKTSWSYAGNYNLTDAGGFTETAGTAWLTWTDNSDDTTRGNITALAIAPNTGGSAGGVFIYNDQGSSYSPGWREVWTSATDGAGSGLDADLLDGQHASAFASASHNHAGVYQPAGTYNTIIGTDTDINTSGSTIIDNIFVTDGVITSMGTRTLTAGDLGALTGNQTITLSGDLTGSGTTSINAQIAANVVGANELNVSGNGTSGQVLSSDGDGSMTWTTPSSGGVTTGKAIAMAIVFG